MLRGLSLLLLFVTLLLLGTANPPPHQPRTPLVSIWATFLGVSSAILAAIQYMPQIVRTYRSKLVGALSIPMMCMQSPGAIDRNGCEYCSKVCVISVQGAAQLIKLLCRPDTDWTSMYQRTS